MNRRFFIYMTAVFFVFSFLFSCHKSYNAEDDARVVAEQFSDNYYSWKLKEALRFSDKEMQQRIRFLASNITKADLLVLHEATEVPKIVIETIDIENDSMATADVALEYVYIADSIGSVVHLEKEVHNRLLMKRCTNGWRISDVRKD